MIIILKIQLYIEDITTVFYAIMALGFYQIIKEKLK